MWREASGHCHGWCERTGQLPRSYRPSCTASLWKTQVSEPETQCLEERDNFKHEEIQATGEKDTDRDGAVAEAETSYEEANVELDGREWLASTSPGQDSFWEANQAPLAVATEHDTTQPLIRPSHVDAPPPSVPKTLPRECREDPLWSERHEGTFPERGTFSHIFLSMTLLLEESLTAECLWIMRKNSWRPEKKLRKPRAKRMIANQCL